MRSRHWRVRIPAAIAMLMLLCTSGFGQDNKRKMKSATLEGTTGLFKTYDAETLKLGEFNFSAGFNHFNRDPGELIIKEMPLSWAVGLHDRVEFFGWWDVQKRTDNGGSRFYRLLPGQLPRPAQSFRTGMTSFTNEAPFIDVPLSWGRGDVHLGGKFALLSERLGHPLGMSVVGFVKLPTSDSIVGLNRNLSTGTVDGGLGYLFSKRAGNIGQFHLNTMFNFVQDPELQGAQLADLQHEFIYRGGAAFPTYGNFHVIAEVDGKTYFGDRTRGLNPRSPVDLILGVRAYPKEWISFGVGYRASLNKMQEEPSQLVFASGVNGLVAQLAIGRRTNEPPAVNCVVSNASIVQGESTTIRASAVDRDGDLLTYAWTSSGGAVSGVGETATFDSTGVAPGRYTVTATVSDGRDAGTCSAEVTVLKRNEAPTVRCEPSTASVIVGDSVTLRAVGSDPNNDPLTYSWTVNGQRLAADGPSITFGTVGRQPGNYSVAVTASDGELTSSCTITVTVQEKPNRQPQIQCLTTSLDVASGGTVELKVQASDPDGDPTTVSWSATGGTVSGSAESGTFNASGVRAGSYIVTATVTDNRGGRASCTMTVNVSERLTLGPFASGRARVDNVMKAALDDIAVRMRSEPRLHANVIGYTDNSGADRGLGRRRAQNVADYLKSKGVDASRLTVTDGGRNNPVGDNRTSAGRRQNRRVEIELTIR